MRATNELRRTGTANPLRAAVAAGAKRIVAESMVFAYGFGDHGATPKTEADALREREPHGWLQETVDSLRSLEGQLLEAGARGSVEAVPLRYGFFYSSDTPSAQYMVRMIRRRLFPTAKGARRRHVDPSGRRGRREPRCDGARPRRGGLNVVDDEPVGMNDWILEAARALGAPRPFSVPLWLLRLLMPYAAAVFDTRLLVSNHKAKAELGRRPQYPGYREGLREVAANA